MPQASQPSLVIQPSIADTGRRAAAIKHARRYGIILPTFAELAAPETIPSEIRERLDRVPPDEPLPLNLFRLHWHNTPKWEGFKPVPAYVEFPSAMTGVKARIVMVLGNSFPLIGAHKVLAAYGCLVQRLVTGLFDPTNDKSVWPSTGNYCRGGVAIARMLGCTGVAVLPEGMSRERFDWLAQWTRNPQEDIVRTPGSESNVKEIYDMCDRMARDRSTVIVNQFSEFGNYLVHRHVTGAALARLCAHLGGPGKARAAAFVSGVGSAGTLAAGDHLKDLFGTKIVVTEPIECPTLRCNGYGEHNIQGIGDKHVTLIHNVFNTDFVIGVSEQASDLLNVLFNTETGRAYVAQRFGLDATMLDLLSSIGLSGLANLQAAIKYAKHGDLGPDDVILTVATDGADLYRSEIPRAVSRHCRGRFETMDAAEACGRILSGCEPAYVLELSHEDRSRIFNLGYYTWVEQRGIALDAFDRRRRGEFWADIARSAGTWDEQIRQFNAEVGTIDGNRAIADRQLAN